MARKRRASASRADVFISHSSLDRVFAEKIVDVLKRHGVASWYAPARLLGAQVWHDEIGRALRHCDWFLLILSENALNSKWVKRELTYALNDDRYNESILCDRQDSRELYAIILDTSLVFNKSISPAISTKLASTCSGSGVSYTSLIDRKGTHPPSPPRSRRGDGESAA